MDKTFEIIIILLLLGIIAEVYLLTRPKRRYDTRPISMLVDTSVLMDGRVVDLAETGFLLGQVIVPRSVLGELQLLADGADHDKRERARLGLDAVKKLQDMLGSSFELLQDGSRTRNGVDEQLIALAKQTDSSILTLDYNLNKVAQVEGVKVLNINELAKSIRMVHLPGDTVQIELSQKGQGSDQAVGYLSDGTMVVVEQAKRFVGKSREVEIIRSLQTDAGKMMFAKLVQAEPTQAVKRPAPVATKKPSNGRRRDAQTEAKIPPASATKSDSRNRKQKQPSANQAARSQKSQRQRPKTSAQREAELIRLIDSQN